MKKPIIFGILLLAAVAVNAVELPDTAPVQYREVAQTYIADGLVEAVRQSTVSAQISGRVVEINFDVGDHVNKGQVILRIDEREAVQAVAGSQAQLMQAQANMQNSKAAYERAKQLFVKKFISQAALDKAQAEYKVALAQTQASEALAGQSRLMRGYAAVLAPYSGVVAARLVELGEMVMPGKPLMTGFDPAEMRAVADLPQGKLASIGVRGKIEAMVEAPSLNRWIKPTSATLHPVADTRTHSTKVRMNLPKNVAGIYPGMFMRVHFVIGKINKLVIPFSAVLRRGEVTAVYVVDENGAVKLRQIRLGDATLDGAVEVLAGLNQGEKVALDPVKAGIIKRR